MTYKQLRFIEEYPKDWNGTQAAIRAGYSPKGADVAASRLLADVRVKEKIDELKAKLSGEAGITIERILSHISMMAFADRTLIYDDSGQLRPIAEWPADVRACLEGIDIEEQATGFGRTKKVKLASKDKWVEMLMKYTGLYEKDNKQKVPKKLVIGYEEDDTE